MRRMRTWVAAVVVLCPLASVPSAASAQVATRVALRAVSQSPCSCSSADTESLGTGVVWQGVESLRLADIAALTAPVLWFSSDEPLLAPEYGPVPRAHPCDAPASEPVVYYQVTRIAHRGDTRVSRAEEDEATFFDKVDKLTLRFFFYYPEDVGRGGHVHDLEGVDLEIALDTAGPCRRVRVVRVEGMAHGNRWHSNILDVAPDTKFPIAVLVEQGKHAGAPDRNADGRFERGYDVTSRINDAWGVRDPARPGVPRTDGFRLLPPSDPRFCVPAGQSSIDSRPSLGRYSMRPANRVPTCAVPVNGTFLTDMMAYHGFGEAQEPVQFREGSLRGRLNRMGGPDEWLSLSLRGAGSRIGAAIVLKGLDLRQGWLVPRLVIDDVAASAEGMFTPSASRWADVYLSAGAERQFETVTEGDTAVPPNWSMAIEAGIKLRAEIPQRVRPFALGCNFGGVRLGLRGVGFPTVDRWRFIWEVGIGAW